MQCGQHGSYAETRPQAKCVHALRNALQVRIGGGVYPDIVEADYLAGGTDYRVDAAGTKTMLSSLMYRLCYYK